MKAFLNREWSAIRRLVKRPIRKDVAAVAAVEFAIILPVMITMYLGGAEISRAVTVQRKISHVASVMGDLVAQSFAVSDADIDGIFEAADAIMYPYTLNLPKLTVAGVSIDSGSNPSFAWTKSKNGGATIDLGEIPTSMLQPDTFLVVAASSYEYTPNFGESFASSYTLKGQFYLHPRAGNEVEYVN